MHPRNVEAVDLYKDESMTDAVILMDVNKLIDWGRFREEAYLTVCDAVQHYVDQRKGSVGAPVIQALLWTDPQAHMTGFELLTYDARLQIGAYMVAAVDGALQRLPIGTVGYGGWDFARYHVVYNESLRQAYAREWLSPDGKSAILNRIGIELNAAKAQIEQEGVLLALPRRGEFVFDVEWLFD